uniref:TRAF3-interacting protein 1 n=1 Tax=Heliothis virescens TaxID=7102 RepID=A0A2A4J3A0_HELVI
MEKELDPNVIKSTQLSLGKYVKRPPLSEKLLKKPPFRFLHDIVTTVLKTTGFFENLFEENELISENVKDRESKISFLSKVIFVLSTTTGKSLSAKPSKIVAGQEPEKTNELLQCLAQALDRKLSSEEAVKKYKESTKSIQISEPKSKEPNKSTKKAIDPRKLTSRSTEKLGSQRNDVTRSTNKQDKEKANDVKSRRKENASVKTDPQIIKKPQQAKTINTRNGKDKEKRELPKEDNTKSQKKIISLNSTEKYEEHDAEHKPQVPDSDIFIEENREDNINMENEIVSPRIEQTDEGKLNSSYTIAENDLNSSSSSNDLNEIEKNNKDHLNSLRINNSDEKRLTENDEQNQSTNESNDNMKTFDSVANNQDSLQTQVFRNDSANEKTDVDKHTEDTVKVPVTPTSSSNTLRPPSVRPSSSRPGAPRMREKLDNVIRDSDNLLLGKVNIIIENTQNEEEEESSLLILEQQEALSAPQDQQDLQLSSNEHGHLVQQILDSQKELSQMTGKTEIEWQFGAQKAREAVNQEIEQLRFNIQAMSRVANPLGKLLDHVQEDVEVMRQELHQWSKIYEDVTKEMLKQKTLNEDSLTPFHTKLKQIDRDIEEKHDKINDLKILIHKNTFRIEKLLMSGSVQ